MYSFQERITIPKGKELVIAPFGDIQSDEILDELDDVVNDLIGHQKAGNIVRGFGLGDYFETFSPSERARKAGANFHETTLADISKDVHAKADHIAGRLAPLTKRISTISQGHHWDFIKTKDGRLISSDAYIAEKLGAQFAGDGVTWLEYMVNGHPFDVIGMHGYGSARTPGARLNKRVAMKEITPTANWYCMGHDNSMVSDPRFALKKMPNGTKSYIKQYFSGIGCIQTAYSEGLEASYAEKLALPPAAIGFVKMRVCVREKNGKQVLSYKMEL